MTSYNICLLFIGSNFFIFENFIHVYKEIWSHLAQKSPCQLSSCFSKHDLFQSNAFQKNIPLSLIRAAHQCLCTGPLTGAWEIHQL